MAVDLNTRGQLESAFHGTSWLVMLNVVLYSIISVAVTVWFTALIRARWSGDGPLRSRAGRASYATYVLHPLVLTAIMVLSASLTLAPELKFLVVAVAAVPACFLAGWARDAGPCHLQDSVTARSQRMRDAYRLADGDRETTALIVAG